MRPRARGSRTLGGTRLISESAKLRDVTASARPFLVVITGAPGSGKTTLGWELSRLLHVPLVSRDDIKTGLHVTGERRHGEVELARPA